ncbi:hypothetical protein [Sphingobacterium lactis]|uniref:hypothetical protein n=1 Tax=Sphingobacterium lactis TaxID=797291 RepID=UPI003DA6C9E1
MQEKFPGKYRFPTRNSIPFVLLEIFRKIVRGGALPRASGVPKGLKKKKAQRNAELFVAPEAGLEPATL